MTMPDIKETCQMLWEHITGKATLVWVWGRSTKGSNIGVETCMISCWLGEDGNMESEESMCVPDGGNIMFKRTGWICLAAVMALGKHVFWSTVLTFAAK